MGESRTDPALNIVEISGLAWALTVHKAAEVLAGEPEAEAAVSAYRESAQAEASRQLEAEDPQAMEAELRRAGIVDGQGAITRQWVLAVWIAASAPVKAAAVVQSQDLSVHTELGLTGGRGVGITYYRRIRHSVDGVAVTEVRNAVEISFFREEDAWAAIRRHLPAAAERQAAPDAVVGETGPGATHTFHLEVSAAVPVADQGHHPGHVSRDAWALAERSYSIADLSREVAWRVLGAREYLASAAEKAA
ncbi:hypothetical protein NIBR502772_06675 [Pseudarthrobacter sp. NIBRBAC000502772]|uniref:hypothetical protein n=1 Tax=Pseudarthrobacter sp. NIBRBAC000502772 TaxID=2590775 RepID=UPI00113209CE|nr:hypothetical protein [Pseudarthrobacter sp. NIBRBAC000502772]QDG65938.1 hypothetical protein NIBR502772_06675 [Pseudarthrobacter sp. NIBRBAC000502772]